MPIYIIDTVHVRPGRGREFIEQYLSGYRATAEDRGHRLDRITVSPPVWLDEGSNTITATWVVDGPAEWWKAAVQVRYDPGPADWWRSVDDLIEDRRREMAAPADAIEELCDV